MSLSCILSRLPYLLLLPRSTATLDALLRCVTLHRESLHAAVCRAQREGAPAEVITASLRGETLAKLGSPAHLSADDLLSALTLIAGKHVPVLHH
jgi:hypothetical protein